MFTNSVNGFASIGFQSAKSKKQNRPYSKNSVQNSLERTPSNDTLEKKKGMGTGAKIALATLGAVAATALLDVICTKGKNLKKIFGKADDVVRTAEPLNFEASEVVFQGGKAFNKEGKLFTGVLSKTSKSGNELTTAYFDGEVVMRTYRPKNTAEFKEIVKKYDTKTHEGVKLVKGEKKMLDGTKKHSLWACFTERQFPPEIEAKIKMKDFEKLDLAQMEFGKKDLGDGIVLEVKKDIIGQKECSILKNDKCVASLNAPSSFYYFFNYKDMEMMKSLGDGKFSLLMIPNSKGQITYHTNGTSEITKYVDEAGNRLTPQNWIIERYDALGNLIK
ncbi:hypothetical protein IKB17_03700 [bacterium]|nr:hypothetical protein [bacterium]